MSTASEIIDEAKLRLRINGTELDTTLLQRLNRIYRSYCRKEGWPQLRVIGYSITLTTDQTYALPANFDRFEDDTLLFDVDGSGNVLGGSIPVSFAGDDLSRTQFFATVDRPTSALVTYTAGLPYLTFVPHFTSTSSRAVIFNYFKQPAVMTSPTTPEVSQLEETLVSALCKEGTRYHGLAKEGAIQARYFAEEERSEYRTALRYLYSTPHP